MPTLVAYDGRASLFDAGNAPVLCVAIGLSRIRLVIGQRTVGVGSSGSEKGEQRQPIVSLTEVNFCHQRHRFIPWCLDQHTPKGVDDAAGALKVD